MKKLLLIALAGVSVYATPLYAEGQPEAVADVSDEKPACLKADELSNKLSPEDLYKSLGTCITEKKFDEGALLYGLAMTYGLYDTYRVADVSKHSEATNPLITVLMKIDKETNKKFQNEALARIGKGPGMIAACKTAINLGAPDYIPHYMIGEGVDPAAAGVMVPDFDRKAAWLKALSLGLRCPTKDLQLKDNP